MVQVPSEQTIPVHDHKLDISVAPPFLPEHGHNLDTSTLFPPWRQITDYPLTTAQMLQIDPHATSQSPQSDEIGQPPFRIILLGLCQKSSCRRRRAPRTHCAVLYPKAQKY